MDRYERERERERVGNANHLAFNTHMHSCLSALNKNTHMRVHIHTRFQLRHSQLQTLWYIEHGPYHIITHTSWPSLYDVIFDDTQPDVTAFANVIPCWLCVCYHSKVCLTKSYKGRSQKVCLHCYLLWHPPPMYNLLSPLAKESSGNKVHVCAVWKHFNNLN